MKLSKARDEADLDVCLHLLVVIAYRAFYIITFEYERDYQDPEQTAYHSYFPTTDISKVLR